MRVLMLSIDDQTLLARQMSGQAGLGDTRERHIRYGELVERLDIIVTSKPGLRIENLSDKVTVYPTNARTPWGHFLAVLKHAKKLFNDDKYDLIVAQDFTAPAAWWLRLKYKVPYLITAHGSDMESADWQSKKTDILLKPIIKYAIKQADGLRVVSSGMRAYYRKIGVKSLLGVVPTPIDLTQFAKDHTQAAEEIRRKYGENIILTVGRLEPVKDYPMLFDVLIFVRKKFKGVKLLIVGVGSQEGKLKKLIKEKDLTVAVEFIGGMPYEELPPYFQACKVFALASQSESLGQVLIQAGASGRPAVATRTLGAQDIVKDGETGFLVEVGNTEAMANEIIGLLEDNSLNEQMGIKAQRRVTDKYNSQKNINKLIYFWQEISNKL